MLHFYEIADNDFIDCILEKKHFPQPSMCINDLYSINEFPFSHILGYLQLVTGNRD